eukprot:593053-Hanusia_phi.AAC.1
MKFDNKGFNITNAALSELPSLSLALGSLSGRLTHLSVTSKHRRFRPRQPRSVSGRRCRRAEQPAGGGR